MAASRKVVFHLGGGDMSEENQWPRNTPTAPTSSTETTSKTQPETPTTQHSLPSLDDIWSSLTIALQKMNAKQPETQFGF